MKRSLILSLSPPHHIALSLSLYSIHYLSHAFPLHRNHQQRKPTRPPTTATTATAMPAMAPVRRPLLLLPEDTQEAPASSGLYPSLHTQTELSSVELLGQPSTHDFLPGLTFPLLHASHMSSLLQWEHPSIAHAKHPLPSLLGFLLLSQEVHTAAVMPPSDGAAGAVHAEQPSTPTYALVSTSVPNGLPHANTD
eukprot:XP_001703901.1 Hypothetical protein GL50803_3378 [Giardia lamblia ATCC 50803]